MNIIIQRATTSDIPTILSILSYGVKNKIRRGDLAWGEKDVEANAIEPYVQEGTAYIALLDNQVVGTFVLDWQDEVNWGPQPQTACYLKRFAVATGYHGQNIGGQILDLLANTVKTQGNLSSIRLVCPSVNTKLRAYYEKQGFTRADSNAKPTLPRTDIVYYERIVVPSTGSVPASRSGFLHKLLGR